MEKGIPVQCRIGFLFRQESSKKTDAELKEEELTKMIGQQKIELEYLKKVAMKTFIEKKSLIEANNKKLSITKQCEFKVNRSSLYYKSSQESHLNLKLMRLMDEHYLEHPYKGAKGSEVDLFCGGFSCF